MIRIAHSRSGLEMFGWSHGLRMNQWLTEVAAGIAGEALMIHIKQKGTGKILADIPGVSLEEADLQERDLFWAELENANLIRANLSGADLGYADLRGAMLNFANLLGANLHGANLEGTCLARANLRNANLRDADLRGAELFETDLSGADLSGADLSDIECASVISDGARYDDRTRGVERIQNAAVSTEPEHTSEQWEMPLAA